jgi:gas vesicle protein
MQSRNFKTPQIKKLKRHRLLNELSEDVVKHQSETKDTIKREIYEIKKAIQNIKEDLHKDMKNLRKKSNRTLGSKKSTY